MDKLNDAAVIIESLLTGVYIYNLVDKNNEYINKQYTKITGWTIEELNGFGEKFVELFHPEDREAVMQYMQKVATSASDMSHTLEYRFKHKDGRWIWCLSYDTPYERDNEGKLVKFIGSFIDITDRKEAEEKMKKAVEDVEKTNKMMTGRELKMIELKKEVNELLKDQGKEEKYKGLG